jgi:hypothetical protein
MGVTVYGRLAPPVYGGGFSPLIHRGGDADDYIFRFLSILFGDNRYHRPVYAGKKEVTAAP